jgi:hypothetical protein
MWPVVGRNIILINPMLQYINPIIGIKVEFPNNWDFRYWGNRKQPPVNPDIFQSSYDDLPSASSPHKILFTAMHRYEKGQSLIRGVVEFVALYREGRYDVDSEFQPHECELTRSYGKHTIAGNEAEYLHFEQQGDGYISIRRIYYWEYQPSIWIGCMVGGNSLDQFNEALSIVENVKKLKLVQ